MLYLVTKNFPYSGSVMMTKDRLVDILHEIRKKRVCSYTGWMCDCKFGAEHINNCTYEDNGCPELWVVADIFTKMTEEEFNGYMSRLGRVVV